MHMREAGQQSTNGWGSCTQIALSYFLHARPGLCSHSTQVVDVVQGVRSSSSTHELCCPEMHISDQIIGMHRPSCKAACSCTTWLALCSGATAAILLQILKLRTRDAALGVYAPLLYEPCEPCASKAPGEDIKAKWHIPCESLHLGSPAPSS